MKNVVVVTICGRTYHLVPDEDSANLETVAQQVDQAMMAALKDSRTTQLDAAVLTAVNAVETMNRTQDTLETVRTQLQEVMETNKRLRQELADTRRELTRLKNGRKTTK